MTENEAIKEVMIQKLVCESMIVRNNNYFPKNDNTNLETKIKADEIAIKALEEIQEYRKIGTVEECREAAEKSKAKKPEIAELNTGTKYLKCPNCKLTTVIYNNMIVGYCPKCGQKLEE